MKKILMLFVFPALTVLLLFTFKNDFAIAAAQTALIMQNPFNSIKYSLQNDSALNVSGGIDEPVENQGFDNPFADVDIDSLTPQSSAPPSPPIQPDPDHPIVEMTYSPVNNNITYNRQNCYIKNVTDYPRSEVETELLAPLDFTVEKNSDKPQILIMHTHATESYQEHSELYYDPAYTCRNTDTQKNMVSVGKILSDRLNQLGYNTLHDSTLHDYPNYNGSYQRSKATVESYLQKYPSIKVVLDIHRDAIERSDGTRIKPVITIDGKRYAQIMIISGADNGYLNMPNFKKNLRFASHIQNSMEGMYPGFTRPILFDYRNYNQQLTTGSLLIEVGGHANTLQEAQNSALLIANGLAAAFDSQNQ